MRDILSQLIDQLVKKKINKQTLMDLFYNKTGCLLDENLCIENIKKGIADCDEDVYLFFYVGFMIGFSSKALPVLCKAIISPCHMEHEEIVDFFNDMADPSTVNYLYEAAELELEYLDYDDTFQFSRKCIKALSKIGNEQAIEKILLLANSYNSVISEYAKKELRYKGIDS